MKKSDKIDVLLTAKDKVLNTTCYYSYNYYWSHHYVGDVNNRFVFGIIEDDFILNGYIIRKLSRINKVLVRNDITEKIGEMLGIKNQINYPSININSWKDIFSNECFKDELIELELYNDGTFYFGKVIEVNKNSILFLAFDADGLWDKDKIKINYRDIDGICWNSRYLNGWKYYFNSLNED